MPSTTRSASSHYSTSGSVVGCVCGPPTIAIVWKNCIDMVPKTVMYFLVNHVKDELQNELVGELYREEEVGHLMKEAEDIALRRRTCVEMRELLEKALEIVNEVRDFNSFTK